MGLTELSPFENSKENFKYEKQWEQGKYDNIVKVAKEINKKIEMLFIEKVRKFIPDFNISDLKKYKDKFEIRISRFNNTTEYIYKPKKNKEILLFKIEQSMILTDLVCKTECKIVENKNNTMNIKREIPCKCPVCDGTGKVPRGFYNPYTHYNTISDITPETCISCGGTGIIMGKETEVNCDLTNEA